MGNTKNKRNSLKNTHRHAYLKKKNPKKTHYYKKNQQMDTEQQTDTEQQMYKEDTEVAGSRIIDLNNLQQYTNDLTEHSTHCQGSITLSGESREGLASVLSGNCLNCSETVELVTSKKVKGLRGYNRLVCQHLWGLGSSLCILLGGRAILLLCGGKCVLEVGTASWRNH